MYPDSNIFMITVATFLGGFAGALLSIWQSGLEPNNMQVHTDFQIAMKSSMRVGYRAALIGFIFVSIPIFVSGLILGIEISTLVLITITLASIHGLIWWAYVGGGGVAVAYNTFNLLRLWNIHPSNMWDFLRYATGLILLRKVGGGYIFIHRYLLEYFADMETPE